MRGTLTHRSSYSNFEDKETDTQVVEDQAKGRGTRRVANRHTCRLTSTSRIKPRGTHTHTGCYVYSHFKDQAQLGTHTNTRAAIQPERGTIQGEEHTRIKSKGRGTHTPSSSQQEICFRRCPSARAQRAEAGVNPCCRCFRHLRVAPSHGLRVHVALLLPRIVGQLL